MCANLHILSLHVVCISWNQWKCVWMCLPVPQCPSVCAVHRSNSACTCARVHVCAFITNICTRHSVLAVSHSVCVIDWLRHGILLCMGWYCLQFLANHVTIKGSCLWSERDHVIVCEPFFPRCRTECLRPRRITMRPTLFFSPKQ